MRNARTFLSIVFSFLVAISMVSALYNCQSSQTIMKLSTINNAHVETFSSSTYSLRVCYDEIFGVNYTNAAPQVCTGTNLVSKLSQSTNAHIEGPTGVSYPVSVCYGDLVCAVRNSCLANEAQVISLAQATNSHASMINSYPLKLCCSSAFAIANTNTTNATNNTNTGSMSFTIISPVASTNYNNSALLSISSVNATSILYNLGAGNISYFSPINLSLANGTYTLNVYAINSTTTLAQSISFTIINTSLTNSTTTNATNNTNTGSMSFTIISPLQNTNYSGAIPINITSQNASSVLYNFGTGNFTYISPTIVSLTNGSYNFTVYVSNSTTLLQQSVLFNIVNSTTTTNPTNTTNSSNTNTGFMNFTINSPVPDVNYSGSVPINITFQNASSVLYNFGTGNFTYISPTIVSLTNGSYNFTVYVSNSTTTIQQTISFNIVNSTVSSNPTNITNSSNGGGNNGNNNGNSGGSSGGGVNSGTTIAKQKLQSGFGEDEPIVLGETTTTKKSTIGVTFFQSMFILLILIALIVVGQIIINRHFQSKNKRL